MVDPCKILPPAILLISPLFYHHPKGRSCCLLAEWQCFVSNQQGSTITFCNLLIDQKHGNLGGDRYSFKREYKCIEEWRHQPIICTCCRKKDHKSVGEPHNMIYERLIFTTGFLASSYMLVFEIFLISTPLIVSWNKVIPYHGSLRLKDSRKSWELRLPW